MQYSHNASNRHDALGYNWATKTIHVLLFVLFEGTTYNKVGNLIVLIDGSC